MCFYKLRQPIGLPAPELEPETEVRGPEALTPVTAETALGGRR
jgi:hypothetical protein